MKKDVNYIASGTQSMKQTITIENYKSKYFPFIAKWKVGSVTHSDVFVRKEYAIEHMRTRFRNAKIVDKTGDDSNI